MTRRKSMTPAELVQAHEVLNRRVHAVVAVIEAVARKTRPEYLPAGFQPLLHNRRRSIHPHGPKEHIQVRYDIGSALEFPIVLLASGDRDVAVWARERIRACRHVAFQKVKKQLADDIAQMEIRIGADERTLQTKRRELANLGKTPRYERPTRYPKVKKPKTSA